ncbi:MAG: argininosuccinate lyase [Rhodobacteraceae bacterium]|nr:argininosuccinate lyase [Paracoccaceae bacterium]MCW9043283.1 argininosuccinate lyase [Pseudopelagicola sp.]
MRILALFAITAVLAACGADGPPEAPTMDTTVGIGTNGAFGATHIRQGPVTITLGTGF